jgi:HemY protein
MRTLLWAVFIALLAVVLALLAQFNLGNVVFMLPPHRIDLSFNFFLLLAGGLLVAVYWFGRLLQRVNDFPARVKLYRQRRAEVGSQRALREALKALLEGRFARAERAARAAQVAPENSGLAALIGARAAHRLQQPERRDHWLEALEGDPALQAAALVSGAEMWAESRDNLRALEAIDRLQSSGSRHLHAARIALNANLQAGRWNEVIKGTRILEKRKALHEVLARRYRQIAYRELLAESRHDAAALEAAWNRIAADDRREPELAIEAARLLNLAGRGRAAAAAIETALEKRWDERLLDEYARAAVFPARERIERAERWLQDHPRDPALLRCLGVLCMREQLWGKARSYLEESARLRTYPPTSLALARLAEATGDEAEAAQHFREAALGFANLLAQAGVGAPSARAAARELTL